MRKLLTLVVIATLVAPIFSLIPFIGSNNMTKLLDPVFYDRTAMGRLPVYVGSGYDLFKGNPKADKIDPGFRAKVFNLKYDQNLRTEDRFYVIPNGMISNNRFSGSMNSKFDQYTGTKSYQSSLRVLVDVAGRANAGFSSASFSASTEFQSLYQTTLNQQNIFLEISARCEVYSLELISNQTLNQLFKSDVLNAYQTRSLEDWKSVIRKYGTHYVTKTILGGRMHILNEMKSQSLQELKQTNIDIKAAAKAQLGSLGGGSISAQVDVDQTSANSFESKVENRKEYYIGGKPPASGSWIDWYNEALDNPVPIEYKIEILSQLFTSDNFESASINDLNDMISQFQNAIESYCKDIGCISPDVDPLLEDNPTSIITFTDSIGINNGTPFCDFDIFSDSDQGDYSIRKAYVKSGLWIDGIRFMVANNYGSYYTPPRGDIRTTIDDTNYFDIPSTSYISQVELTYADAKVKSLRFITNDGKKSGLVGNIDPLDTYKLVKLDGELIGIFGTQDIQLHNQATSLIRSIGFIQRKSIFEIPSIKTCPDGWISYGYYCYFWVRELVNYDQATAGCKARSSNLVIIRSLNQLKFILSKVTDKDYGFWFGLKATLPRVFKNSDGSKNMLRWCPNEPNNWPAKSDSDGIVEGCVQFYSEGCINDISCTWWKFSYICEKNTDSKCPICYNEGSCKLSGYTYSCQCPTGYIGKNCEQASCDQNPCLNGGTCIINPGDAANNITSTYSCTCVSGFSGKQCEITPCQTANPCHPTGGRCYITSSNTAACSCLYGYTDNKCDRAPTYYKIFRGNNEHYVKCNTWDSFCKGTSNSNDATYFYSTGKTNTKANQQFTSYAVIDTNLCIRRNDNNQVFLGGCDDDYSRWDHVMKNENAYRVLNWEGDGKDLKVTTDDICAWPNWGCTDWKLRS